MQMGVTFLLVCTSVSMRNEFQDKLTKTEQRMNLENA